MFYITALLFGLALYFGIGGFRNNDSGLKGLALGLGMAGVGTLIIMMFAYSVL